MMIKPNSHKSFKKQREAKLTFTCVRLHINIHAKKHSYQIFYIIISVHVKRQNFFSALL